MNNPIENTLDDIENILEAQRAQIDPIVMECMKEIFHHIPKAHKFTLSNGKEADIQTFYEPKNNDGDYSFGIDVKIKDFPVDHIEFIMSKTGQGGSYE